MLTALKKCSTDGCQHVFQSVNILYGSSALGRCPVCGVYVDLPCDTKKTERVTSDPDAAIARSYVSSGHSSLCYASLDALLLRLADKVEGKS